MAISRYSLTRQAWRRGNVVYQRSDQPPDRAHICRKRTSKELDSDGTYRTHRLHFPLLFCGRCGCREREFGDGRAPAFCCAASGWRRHDGGLLGVRPIPQDGYKISIAPRSTAARRSAIAPATGPLYNQLTAPHQTSRNSICAISHCGVWSASTGRSRARRRGAASRYASTADVGGSSAEIARPRQVIGERRTAYRARRSDGRSWLHGGSMSQLAPDDPENVAPPWR